MRRGTVEFLAGLASRRRRLLALGWVVGVPVLFLVQLGYAWVAFGTIGHLPEP